MDTKITDTIRRASSARLEGNFYDCPMRFHIKILTPLISPAPFENQRGGNNEEWPKTLPVLFIDIIHPALLKQGGTRQRFGRGVAGGCGNRTHPAPSSEAIPDLKIRIDCGDSLILEIA
jgi:hypothetical protein